MKAGIFFAGSGPVLILTSYASLTNSSLVEKLSNKGIKKFIAFEVSESTLKEKYGKHFEIIMGDLYQTDDLRVLDYDGHHIFNIFHLEELGDPIFYEPVQ
ncbi:MAG: hypothetical protein JXR80_11625 [Deltaproteobacteria bacterium]|nr:hypothetical protein [Deltaproteobacteria bacterium]